jgi:hypothetical protein
MRYLVITNCTARKRRCLYQPLSPQAIDASSLAELARLWCQQIATAPTCHPAGQLYVGRGFSEALATRKVLAASLFIVSSGLGLVGELDPAPNYDATASPGHTSLWSKLQMFGATPADWWNALTSARGRESPVANLMHSRADSVVLISLPAGYIDLIASDLGHVRPSAVDRLRIFTSPPGRDRLPPILRRAALPYDYRFEASSRAGTKADFPQRAMRHFVEELRATVLPLATSHHKVLESLAPLEAPRATGRQRKSDDEVEQLISEHWERFSGRSTRLLRFLRDEANVACEQSRFKSLWHSVRAERTRGLGGSRA